MYRYALAGLAATLLTTSLGARVQPFADDFRTQMEKTNGTSLFVRSGGKGPAVVLLHGYGDTGDMWIPLAAELARDHFVVVPDLRGMGLSAAETQGFTKKVQAQDVAAVLDALKVGDVSVGGHDIGNMVAFAFAAQYRQRTRQLVVMDAPVPGIGP